MGPGRREIDSDNAAQGSGDEGRRAAGRGAPAELRSGLEQGPGCVVEAAGESRDKEGAQVQAKRIPRHGRARTIEVGIHLSRAPITAIGPTRTRTRS